MTWTYESGALSFLTLRVKAVTKTEVGSMGGYTFCPCQVLNPLRKPYSKARDYGQKAGSHLQVQVVKYTFPAFRPFC